MELMIRKRVQFGPCVRLNIFNSGLSVSVGHKNLGWLTFGKRGITESIDTPVSGVFLRDGQPWDRVLKALRLRK
jgi:hypothetical protein